jgi:hypothetical protein
MRKEIREVETETQRREIQVHERKEGKQESERERERTITRRPKRRGQCAEGRKQEGEHEVDTYTTSL